MWCLIFFFFFKYEKTCSCEHVVRILRLRHGTFVCSSPIQRNLFWGPRTRTTHRTDERNSTRQRASCTCQQNVWISTRARLYGRYRWQNHQVDNMFSTGHRIFLTNVHLTYTNNRRTVRWCDESYRVRFRNIVFTVHTIVPTALARQYTGKFPSKSKRKIDGRLHFLLRCKENKSCNSCTVLSNNNSTTAIVIDKAQNKRKLLKLIIFIILFWHAFMCDIAPTVVFISNVKKNNKINHGQIFKSILKSYYKRG
jgi:hypothetical protein